MNSVFVSLILLVSSQAGSPVAAQSGKFELVEHKLDLGSHDQGEVVAGSVKFKAPRYLVESVRITGTPGLQTRGVEWQDANSGTIHFALDTSQLTENLSKPIVFQPVSGLTGPSGTVGPDTATLSLQVKGKVKITQLAQSETAKRESMVELEVRNLGTAPFKIENVRSTEPAINFSGEEDILPVLAPGEAVVLPVYFIDGNAPKDPELTFRFSAGVFPKNVLYYRLDPSKIQLSASVPTR